MNKIDIKSLNIKELEEFVISIGDKKFRAAQIYQWLHEKLVTDFDDMTNISEKLRNTLKEKCRLTALEPIRIQESSIDGTQKYLFKLYDGNLIESVLNMAILYVFLPRWDAVWDADSVPLHLMEW